MCINLHVDLCAAQDFLIFLNLYKLSFCLNMLLYLSMNLLNCNGIRATWRNVMHLTSSFKHLYYYVNEKYCVNTEKNNFLFFTRKVLLWKSSFWRFKYCGMERCPISQKALMFSSWALLGLFDYENEDIMILVKVGSCLLVPEAWNLQRIITS